MIYPSLVWGSAPADAVLDLLHDDEGDRFGGHRELGRAVDRPPVERGQFAVVNLLKFLWCLRLERRASNQWLQIQGPVGAVSQKYDFGSKPLKPLESWEF